MIDIRSATENDFSEIMRIEREAFGKESEAELVSRLLADPTAEPIINLLAFEKDQAVGHLLFTRAFLEPPAEEITISLLGPLAIAPGAQGKGVGGELIRDALARAKKAGDSLVFVLGHPGYYPRHGFTPALRFGFETLYPLPAKDEGAWMVIELAEGMIKKYQGKVIPCEEFRRPEHWRE